MKKNFPLHVAGKDDPRVVEAIKKELRKYVKRERRKTLPAGFDLWEFNCRVGPDADTAEVKTVNEVIPALDAVAATGATQVYVEILAFASNRPARPDPAPTPADTDL
jgi:hypothetical protein